VNSIILFGFKRYLLQKNKQIQTFTFKTVMQFSEVKSIQKKDRNLISVFLDSFKKNYFNLNALS
jgi:hypothetical protein